MLCYTIDFHSPIGDGLRSIKCTLYSESAKDIPVAWDAIEDYIASVSKYQTMMDIYGHFTEPHPIFELYMDILNEPTDNSSFILRFARKFANFEATKKIVSMKDLQELYKNEEGKELDTTKIVLYLRLLRFDVRVHETNITIPRGYFRCCYPFTLNIHKQISVTWRPTLDITYTNWLNQALTEAKVLLSNPDTETLSQYEAHPNLSHPLKTILNSEEILLGKTVAEGIETIVNNLQHNKYLFSILLTGLVEKLVHPQQDIRSIQADLPGGYSNRSTDQIQVTPFLKRNGLTCCAASGMESGRNLERPISHTLDYQCRPQGKGNREAYLGVIHAVQVEGIDPFPCMVLLMALDLHRKEHFVFNYPKPHGLTIQ